jgi:hypothetical protein
MQVCAHIRLSSPPCPICTRVPAPSNLQEKHEENWLIVVCPQKLKREWEWGCVLVVGGRFINKEGRTISFSWWVFWGIGLELSVCFYSHFFCARGHHPPMQKRVTAISSNDSFGGSGTLMSGLRSLAVLVIVLLCSWAPPPVCERVNTHTHAPPLFPAERVEVLVPTLKHKLCQIFTKTTVLGGKIWVET